MTEQEDDDTVSSNGYFLRGILAAVIMGILTTALLVGLEYLKGTI